MNQNTETFVILTLTNEETLLRCDDCQQQRSTGYDYLRHASKNNVLINLIKKTATNRQFTQQSN